DDFFICLYDKIMCKIIFSYFFFINFPIPRRRKTFQIQFQHSINIIFRHFLNHKFSHQQNPRCYGYWIAGVNVGVAVNLGVVLISGSAANVDIDLISDFAKSLGVAFHPNVAASFDPALVSPSILFPPLYGANSWAPYPEPTCPGHHEEAWMNEMDVFSE